MTVIYAPLLDNNLVPAPKLSQIPSMGYALRQQGYSVISSCPGNMGATSQNVVSSLFANAVNGLTYYADEFSPVSVPYALVIYANWVVNAVPNYYIPSNNDQYVKTTFVNPTTTEIIPVSYSGERLGKIPSRCIRVSDPIPFPITANTKYNPRTHWRTTSYAQSALSNINTTQGSTGPQPNGTDGAGTEDQTELASSTNLHSNSFVVGTYAGIMGFTGANPAKSIGAAGDSIGAATGDAGGHDTKTGGWPRRVAWGGTALTQINMQWPLSTVAYGHVIDSTSGGTLADWTTTVGQARGPMQLLSFASTFLIELGINDTDVLATMQANYIKLSLSAALQGQAVVVSTLIPQTSSSNNWLTVGGQTNSNTKRTNINSWFRDTSASGYVQQCNAAAIAAGLTNFSFSVFEACANVECNSSGVLTLGGGFWYPPQTSAAYTGSVTGGAGGKNSFIDSAFTATLNQWRGYTVVWLTGGNALANTAISNNQTTGGITTVTGTTNNITIGDTYAVYLDVPTLDGTHPSTYSHMRIAASFPTSLIQ